MPWNKRYICVVILAIVSQLSWAKGLSPYSNKELDELEKEFIQLINQSESVERDPLATQYINQIGKKLAYAGGMSTPHFFIVKSKEINAFAGPGGHIGVNSQLILTSQNESELAAVMAHELAHVRLHHLYRMLEHQQQMRIPMLASLLASAALGMINPTVGIGAMMASMGGFSQDNISFTRSKEKEADRIGIDMLIKAGFNPHSMAEFFKKMQASMRYHYHENIPAILRTHPLDEYRIAEAENRTQGLPQTHHESMEYPLFKELIRVSVLGDDPHLFDYYTQQCAKLASSLGCQYGHALIFLYHHRYQQAYDLLSPLVLAYPDILYFQVAMAQAELGLEKYQSAITRLAQIHQKSPENYAVILYYAQILMAADKNEQAMNVLLKGSRLFPRDLPLCHKLAHAQSRNKQKNYAYFTLSQCLLLEGQARAAVAQLKVAQHLSTHDAYLLERIKAKIAEIRSDFDE